MYILALNCGSSSLKYQVFDAGSKSAVVGGNVEKIGLEDSFLTQKYPDGTKQKKVVPMKNHDEALNNVLLMLREASIDLNEIKGVTIAIETHGGVNGYDDGVEHFYSTSTEPAALKSQLL